MPQRPRPSSAGFIATDDLSVQPDLMQHAGWRSRGYVPHCDNAGLIQHVVVSAIGAKGGIESNFGLRLFADPRAASLAEAALLHFDTERYRLLAWCVMPNHMHAVIQQTEGWPLASVVHSWKSLRPTR